ncbi:MAG TPA: helix-turn-helix transcriptional regulator [Kouleothrix sp.]|jgi:putative transcriptional regulator|nr:helix-turn-helix transcriptional regulator [Kouleothrix sp.]
MDDATQHMKTQRLTNTLKVQRAKHNLTQGELASLIGVSRKTINTIESGRFVPSTLLALQLAHTLHCTVEELFTLEEEDAT